MGNKILTTRLAFIAALFVGAAIALYWCVNSGPCGSVCGFLPDWLTSLLGICNGPGNGGNGTGITGADQILDLASNLPAVSSQTNYAVAALSPNEPGCSGSDCVPDQPGQSSGMLSIGGS